MLIILYYIIYACVGDGLKVGGTQKIRLGVSNNLGDGCSQDRCTNVMTLQKYNYLNMHPFP